MSIIIFHSRLRFSSCWLNSLTRPASFDTVPHWFVCRFLSVCISSWKDEALTREYIAGSHGEQSRLCPLEATADAFPAICQRQCWSLCLVWLPICGQRYQVQRGNLAENPRTSYTHVPRVVDCSDRHIVKVWRVSFVVLVRAFCTLPRRWHYHDVC
jgi:hypothetical protein